MRAAYLSLFLQRAGYGTCTSKQFKIAEYAVEATLARAHETGEWQLPVETTVGFEALLALYDAQTRPCTAARSSRRRAIGSGVFLAGTINSPIHEPQIFDIHLTGQCFGAGRTEIPCRSMVGSPISELAI
jgi:hypothetical protein